MRHILFAATLALALAAPSPADAQQPAAQLALTRSASLPDGGWGWAEAVQLTGARVSVPVRGATYAWAGAARGDNKMYSCPTLPENDCRRTTLWMAQAGADYRFRSATALAPYVGAGASLEWWQDGGPGVLMPHIHAGLDWRPTPVVGLRVEAQSEWQFPARLSAGMVLSLP
jgi:opacity protein-like surface antigen